MYRTVRNRDTNRILSWCIVTALKAWDLCAYIAQSMCESIPHVILKSVIAAVLFH